MRFARTVRSTVALTFAALIQLLPIPSWATAMEPAAYFIASPEVYYLPNKAPGLGSFEYYFWFESPSPASTMFAVFGYNPFFAPVNFSGTVVSVFNCTGDPINDCSVGSTVANLVLDQAFPGLVIDGLVLSPGMYAFHFTGQSTSISTALAGQVSVFIYSPATLGLLFAGLAGLNVLASQRQYRVRNVN